MRFSYISLFLFVLLFASASPSYAFTTSPHVEFTAGINTSFCLGSSNEESIAYGCHDMHEAPEPNLDNPENTKLLYEGLEVDTCFTCHNQTGGATNAEGEFGTYLGERTSAHNIFIAPEDGGLLCSSCHTSHMIADDGPPITNGKEIVVLLRVNVNDIWKYLISSWNNLWIDVPGEYEKLAKPIDFCGGCHESSSSAFGDHVSYFSNSVHNGPAIPSPPTTGLTNSQIKCNVCHQQHGSDLPKLLSTNIDGTTISANNNSVCYVCHTNEPTDGGAYKGQEIYEKTKHSTVTDSTIASETVTSSYQAGFCLNCHNPHGTQYTDFRRENKNELCFTCHTEVTLPTNGYSFRGEDDYNDYSAHANSTDSDTVWPSSAYTGSAVGDGGATAGECINCHDPMGRAPAASTTPYSFMLMKWSVGTDSNEQSLCFGGNIAGKCHDNGYNYSQDTDVFYGMTNSVNNIYANLNWLDRTDTSTSGAKINNNHDINGDDQTYSGAKVECSDCHNTHINDRTYNFIDRSRIANPDDTTKNFSQAYDKDAEFSNGQSFSNGGGDLTSSFDVQMPNFVNYCLKCHDGQAPSGVIGATVPFNILTTKYGTAAGADAHGRGGSTNADLKDPYVTGGFSGAYSAMNCNDCHDSHGSRNLYNLKDAVYINGQEMVPSASMDVDSSFYGGTEGWCTSCHASLPANASHDDASDNCGSCHYHGNNF